MPRKTPFRNEFFIKDRKILPLKLVSKSEKKLRPKKMEFIGISEFWNSHVLKSPLEFELPKSDFLWNSLELSICVNFQSNLAQKRQKRDYSTN